jgi:hypothetical protein
MTQKAETLWTNGEKTRYFLAGDELQFTDGDYEIVHCSGTTRRHQGKVLKINAAEIAPYEISKAAAENWAKEQMKAGLKRAGKTAMRFAEFKMSQWAAGTASCKPSASDSGEACKGPETKTYQTAASLAAMLKKLKQSLDTSTGLDSDPKALGIKMEKIAGLDNMTNEEAERFKGKTYKLKGLIRSLAEDVITAINNKANKL